MPALRYHSKFQVFLDSPILTSYPKQSFRSPARVAFLLAGGCVGWRMVFLGLTVSGVCSVLGNGIDINTIQG
jgi:hypothetical protein